MTDQASDPRIGLTVTHRRYVPASHTHYGGDLVDGAYILGLFGDAATELCIRSDGDEGLFAAYSGVQFKAPVRGGDVVEASATLVGIGHRSRQLHFTARIACRSTPHHPSASTVLDPPIIAVMAQGTVVIPAAQPRP
jgi:3-aminobutyryl-CoA ammonia-lyase